MIAYVAGGEGAVGRACVGGRDVRPGSLRFGRSSEGRWLVVEIAPATGTRRVDRHGLCVLVGEVVVGELITVWVGQHIKQVKAEGNRKEAMRTRDKTRLQIKKKNKMEDKTVGKVGEAFPTYILEATRVENNFQKQFINYVIFTYTMHIELVQEYSETLKKFRTYKAEFLLHCGKFPRTKN